MKEEGGFVLTLTQLMAQIPLSQRFALLQGTIKSFDSKATLNFLRTLLYAWGESAPQHACAVALLVRQREPNTRDLVIHAHALIHMRVFLSALHTARADREIRILAWHVLARDAPFPVLRAPEAKVIV